MIGQTLDHYVSNRSLAKAGWVWFTRHAIPIWIGR